MANLVAAVRDVAYAGLVVVACGCGAGKMGETGAATPSDGAAGGAAADAASLDGGGAAAEAGATSNDAGGAGEDAASATDSSGTGGIDGTSATLQFIGTTYTLYASVAGGTPHIVQLDTGSNGLYVPRAVVGASANVSATEVCSITYVSSGKTLSGHKATAAVALLGSKTSGDVSPPPTTVPMSFCAVDDPTWKGGMMGVGFGRGTGASPTSNVLLQISDIQSKTMHAGYVLSTHPTPHVDIGLTSAGLAGFTMVPLTPSPGGTGDWVATSLRGCVSFPQKPSFAPLCGGLLVDTGIPDCLLWGPPDPTLGGIVTGGQTTVPNGTGMKIVSPEDGSVLSYAFVVGQGGDSPGAVSVRKAGGFSVNTGRALLVDYDYAFDAESGRVGFRRGK